MDKFKFEVGSKVVVLLDGFQLPNYGKFFDEQGIPEMKSKFESGADVPVNTIGTIVAYGKHVKFDTNVYVIDVLDKYYVMGEEGVFDATEEVSKEELAKIEKKGEEECSSRILEEMGYNPISVLSLLFDLLDKEDEDDEDEDED